MEQSAACLLEQSGNDKPRVGRAERVTWIIPANRSDRSLQGSQGGVCFEGTRAHSRNKDGKNVLDAITAFKTVGCLNVTFAHAKIGCAVLVVGSCADCRRVSLEGRTMEAGMRSEQVYWVFTVT